MISRTDTGWTRQKAMTGTALWVAKQRCEVYLNGKAKVVSIIRLGPKQNDLSGMETLD